jgi:hypothetical protein
MIGLSRTAIDQFSTNLVFTTTNKIRGAVLGFCNQKWATSIEHVQFKTMCQSINHDDYREVLAILAEMGCQAFSSYKKIEAWHIKQNETTTPGESTQAETETASVASSSDTLDPSKLIHPKLLEDRLFNAMTTKFLQDKRDDLRQVAVRMKAAANTKEARLAVLNEFRILARDKYLDLHKDYDFVDVAAPESGVTDMTSATASGRYVNKSQHTRFPPLSNRYLSAE